MRPEPTPAEVLAWARYARPFAVAEIEQTEQGLRDRRKRGTDVAPWERLCRKLRDNLAEIDRIILQGATQ